MTNFAALNANFIAIIDARNTLQHTATHCNTLHHTAPHCNTLQHTATHCNTLRHTAASCNTLQHTATHCLMTNLAALHANFIAIIDARSSPKCQQHKVREFVQQWLVLQLNSSCHTHVSESCRTQMHGVCRVRGGYNSKAP